MLSWFEDPQLLRLLIRLARGFGGHLRDDGFEATRSAAR